MSLGSCYLISDISIKLIDFYFPSSQIAGVIIQIFIYGLLFGKNISSFIDSLKASNSLLGLSFYSIGYSIFGWMFFNAFRSIIT